jgi:AraC-like DNA-binding protein
VHAVALIDGGYLDKHTINSLSVDSGFKSPVTFFRAFKDKKKQTPLAYATQNG